MRYASYVVLGIVVAAPCVAADQVRIGPRPAWVSEQPVQVGPSETADAPIDILLFDSQQKLEPDAAANYAHYAYRINNAQGLAGANVVAGWNPAFEDVTVHQVIIRRGPQRIDVLGAGQKFTILRRAEPRTADARRTIDRHAAARRLAGG